MVMYICGQVSFVTLEVDHNVAFKDKMLPLLLLCSHDNRFSEPRM